MWVRAKNAFLSFLLSSLGPPTDSKGRYEHFFRYCVYWWPSETHCKKTEPVNVFSILFKHN
jgi:hypothetical protein